MLLENQMVLGNLVNTDFSKEFAAGRGDTIMVRRPVRYEVQKNNLDISSMNKDVVEGMLPVTLKRTASIPMQFDTLDHTLTVEKFSERYIAPAVAILKDTIEADIAAVYNSVSTVMGAIGTPLSTFSQLAQANARMTDLAVPSDMRYAVHTPSTTAALSDNLKSVYVEKKAKTAFEEASVGRYGGFDNYTSVHLRQHTAGAQGGTPLVNGAGQGKTYTEVRETLTQTINIKGLTPSITGVYRAGDAVTFAGVVAVNPMTGQSINSLRTFTIAFDVNSNAAGTATLTISPPIIPSGVHKNVTAAPADNAAITCVTGGAGVTSGQSLFFHRDAFLLVTRPMKKLDSMVWSESVTGNKVAISINKYPDGDRLRETTRLDMLYDIVVIRPELALRWVY